MAVFVFPATSNLFPTDGVVPIPTFVPLSLIIPSTSVVPFHLGTELLTVDETSGSVSNVEMFVHIVAPAPSVRSI